MSELDSRQVDNAEFDQPNEAERVEEIGGSAVYQGVNKPATASTAMALATSQAVSRVTVTALKANTGSIYVGNSAVSSTAYGVELVAGGQITLHVDNLDLVYIAASVASEGVSYIAT